MGPGVMGDLIPIQFWIGAFVVVAVAVVASILWQRFGGRDNDSES